MTTNAEQILNDILADKHERVDPSISPQDFFELFVAEQALKQFDLSFDEIESGIVDGEHDGGVDSFYTFVNGELVDEEVSFRRPKKSAEIEVVIVQSKSANGFSETPIEKLISTSRNLLSLTADFDTLTQYSPAVKGRVEIFRTTYRRLAPNFPSLAIRYIYAAKSASGEVHQNLNLKVAELKRVVNDHFDEATVTFEFWGAKELLALARKRPTQSFELKYDVSLNGESGYVALVALSDFYKFLCGGGSDIRSDLFEANVRDYQGSTEVNAEIAATLASDADEDFWWFNNGVTILASRATSSGSIITIENPQIVNGLQTSSQIGIHFSTADAADTRKVMVRVVASEDDDVRDKIIKATNSQNSVPPASLRATDKVQRDIEHALTNHGLFYDRRKNFYKNEGKPATKIVSISLLAQTAMTLFRGEPDNARARPSSLIKKDEVYSSIFSEDKPLDAYVVCADTIKRVEASLKAQGDLPARDRNNLRFYVLFWVIAWSAKSIALSPTKIAALIGEVTDSDIDLAITKVRQHFEELGATDQVAKGSEFKELIKDKVKDEITATFTLPAP